VTEQFSEVYREKVLADCLIDPVEFCKTFLHDHFSRRMPWVHRGLLAILTERSEFLLKYGELSKIMKNFVHEYGHQEDLPVRQIFHVFVDGTERSADEIKALEDHLSGESVLKDSSRTRIRLDLGEFTLIMMPRGSSKTTIAGFAVPLYKVLFRLDKFSLYVSNAQTHTEAQLESIRKELTENELILAFFGDIRPKKSADQRWAQEKFETLTGIAMQAKGKGSAIRGIHHKNKRPSIILVDDPQDREDVKSDTVRENDKKWAFAELTPARARVEGERGKIIVLGTWLHSDCLVAVWSRDPRFTTVKIALQDLDGDYIWPDYMDAEQDRIEKESFARAGLLPQYYMEYHNREIDDDQLPFPPRFIIYEPELPPFEELICATAFDPATAKTRTADFSAIATLGIHQKTGRTWILDCWLKRGAEDEEKVEEYFRQSLLWHSVLHGLESNAGQAVYGTLIKREMFKRGHYFELEMIAHKTRKVDRIRAALRPRFSAGYMRLRLKFPELEQQLYDFRYDDSHLHDDGPDVVAMCMVLLDPTAAFDAEDDPGMNQFRSEGDEGYDEDLDAAYEIDYEAREWAT
jgi:predicted phage terminase large subunit-like protein